MSIETKIPLPVKFEPTLYNKGLLVPKKLISKLTNNNNASMPTLVRTCDCGGSRDNQIQYHLYTAVVFDIFRKMPSV